MSLDTLNSVVLIGLLLKRPLVSGNAVAAMALEQQKRWLEQVGPYGGSTTYQSLWVAIGAVCSDLTKHDPELASFDSNEISPRSQAPDGDTNCPIAAEIQRFSTAFSDLSGLWHGDVFGLGRVIEKMTKDIWPAEAAAAYRFQLVPFLGDRRREMLDKNIKARDEARIAWADLALWLTRTFRNAHAHEYDGFRPTRQDSETFFENIRWLLEKYQHLRRR